MAREDRTKKPYTYGFGPGNGLGTMVGGVLTGQTSDNRPTSPTRGNTGNVTARQASSERRSAAPSIRKAPPRLLSGQTQYGPLKEGATFTPLPRTRNFNPPDRTKMPLDLGLGPEIDPFADMPGFSSMSLADALNQARGIVGDGGLSELLSTIKGRRGDLEGQAADSRGRITAMYKQLADSISGDRETLDATGEDARQAISSTGAASQAAAKEAFDATQAAQNELRSRLGTQDAAIYEQAAGNQDAQIYQGDVSRSNARTEAANTEVTRNEQSAENQLTGNVAAVGLEGASNVAGIDRQLQTLLAQLTDEESQARNQYGQASNQAALALAQDLIGQNNAAQENRYKQWLDRQNLMRQDANTAWEQGFAERQFGAKQNQAPSMSDWWDTASPSAQFNVQQTENLGDMLGPALDIVGQYTDYGTGAPKLLGTNKVREQLRLAGLDDSQIAQFLNDYIASLGG